MSFFRNNELLIVNRVVLGLNIALLCATLSFCGISCHNIETIGGNMKPTEQLQNDDAEPTDGAMISIAEDAIRGELKDPDSARFSNVQVHRPPGKTPLVCGNVNARNVYGGYVGAQSFISNGVPGITTMLASEMRWREFRKAWNELCRD